MAKKRRKSPTKKKATRKKATKKKATKKKATKKKATKKKATKKKATKKKATKKKATKKKATKKKATKKKATKKKATKKKATKKQTLQLDGAIKELGKILIAEPANVRARLRLGDTFAKKGLVAEACAAYRHVAEAYDRDGFFLKAVAVYKQILKLDPGQSETGLKLRALYRRLGLVPDAT